MASGEKRQNEIQRIGAAEGVVVFCSLRHDRVVVGHGRHFTASAIAAGRVHDLVQLAVVEPHHVARIAGVYGDRTGTAIGISHEPVRAEWARQRPLDRLAVEWWRRHWMAGRPGAATIDYSGERVP